VKQQTLGKAVKNESTNTQRCGLLPATYKGGAAFDT
jgi:hypothetical protein